MRDGVEGQWRSTYLCSICLSLLFSASLLELHATHMHHRGSDLVHVILLFLRETQHIEGLLHG